jgi:hypothetical protein
MGVGVQRQDPTIYPRERAYVPIVQKVGWVPGPVWLSVEERKSLALIRVRVPNRPARCVVDILPHKSLVLVSIPSGVATFYGAPGQ